MEELIKNGVLKKVGEKMFGDFGNKKQDKNDPDLTERYSRFLTRDGVIICIKKDKRLVRWLVIVNEFIRRFN